MHSITFSEKRGMQLEESWEVYMAWFEGKEREKCCNYNMTSKTNAVFCQLFLCIFVSLHLLD